MHILRFPKSRVKIIIDEGLSLSPGFRVRPSHVMNEVNHVFFTSNAIIRCKTRVIEDMDVSKVINGVIIYLTKA